MYKRGARGWLRKRSRLEGPEGYGHGRGPLKETTERDNMVQRCPVLSMCAVWLLVAFQILWRSDTLWFLGASGLVVEYRTRHFQIMGSNLTRGSFAISLEQSTVCSGQLSLLPSAVRNMSSSLQVMRWRPTAVDWGSGMSVGCTV